ncbi:MAG: hypothetical protein HYX77_00425 [Acidobacteria bacterium]|nr:hypothetical protein [Acidobacteriota bacterium]
MEPLTVRALLTESALRVRGPKSARHLLSRRCCRGGEAYRLHRGFSIRGRTAMKAIVGSVATAVVVLLVTFPYYMTWFI